MAISRKPIRGVSSGGTVDVEALINKGGSAPSRESERTDAPNNGAGTAPIVLRLPTSLLAQVDAIIKARPVRIPRHTWLVEAVYEKIRRESEHAST
jgi:hypothetical protein